MTFIPTIAIYVQGGVVQDVATDFIAMGGNPKPRVVIVDFDCEDAGEDGTVQLEDDYTRLNTARLAWWEPPYHFDAIVRIKEAERNAAETPPICGDCGLSVDVHSAETCETVRTWQ